VALMFAALPDHHILIDYVHMQYMYKRHVMLTILRPVIEIIDIEWVTRHLFKNPQNLE
jgi:hypothetical protein